LSVRVALLADQRLHLRTGHLGRGQQPHQRAEVAPCAVVRARATIVSAVT
jgi:hypothetical protein